MLHPNDNKTVFLLIGSNMGDRQSNLNQVLRLLNSIGTIKKKSSVYCTAAWGNKDQDDFLNQAVELITTLPPEQLLSKIMSIEEKMGRIRKEKWGNRVIDVDILFFKNLVFNSPRLIIPHPEIQNRRFALQPMVEIAPEFIHPVFNKTMATLLMECSDKLKVVQL